MNNLILLDLFLLSIFLISIVIFLHRGKKNIGREGPLILYRTKWGIKLINYVGEKYRKTLYVLSYISIFVGFVLMIGILYLMFQTVYVYLTTDIASTVRAPPIAPLVPYFPQLFGLESVFPPFYFIYFAIALIIVATLHEFSHGIFARRFNVNIKSTGFAFLKYFPVFFGAFVEQDDEQMTKKKKFEQMAILSAGVFANIITALIFFVILILFFQVSFSPAGVSFDTYSYDLINISGITSVNNILVYNLSYDQLVERLDERELNKIVYEHNKKYVLTNQSQTNNVDGDYKLILAYHDAPAINSKLGSVIAKINGIEIKNISQVSFELSKYSPGERINITTLNKDGETETQIVLEENPSDTNSAWLGIGFLSPNRGGISGLVYSLFTKFKEEKVYYSPNYENFSVFVYDLIWWVILINFLVALFNMLPLGFLDGGRFFYLSLWGITGSESFAKKTFSAMTYFLLFLFFVLMAKWIFVFF